MHADIAQQYTTIFGKYIMPNKMIKYDVMHLAAVPKMMFNLWQIYQECKKYQLSCAMVGKFHHEC